MSIDAVARGCRFTRNQVDMVRSRGIRPPQAYSANKSGLLRDGFAREDVVVDEDITDDVALVDEVDSPSTVSS